MASIVLYPPVVDSYMPAFQVGEGPCRIYFRLSKYNSSVDFTTVHASIYKQSTGTNVVNRQNDGSSSQIDKTYIRYRTTGIILNIKYFSVEGEDNLYYIELTDKDLAQGWSIGWIYKIQLRLSTISYVPSGTVNGGDISSWLNTNADSFSEWSTVCTIKATGKINYKIPFLSIDSRKEGASDNLVSQLIEIDNTILDLSGHFIRQDITEPVHSYRFILYKGNSDDVIEDSKELYCDEYQNVDNFKYLFTTELEDQEEYSLAFKYETINKLVGGRYELGDRYYFICSDYKTGDPPCEVITADNSKKHDFYINPPDHIHINSDDETPSSDPNISPNFSSTSPVELGDGYDRNLEAIQEENEEGRISLKLIPAGDKGEERQFCNLCIKRSDSRSNFKKWENIFIYQCNNQLIEDIPMFYDYTIESGIFYRYGVQEITTEGVGRRLREQPDTVKVIREFEYSYLLGKDNKQLKFKFDNTINNFKYQIYDSKIDPLGSKYPVIARNAKTYYRTFPINGLITFNMDESMSFSNRYDIIGSELVDVTEGKTVADWYGEWKYGETVYNDYYKEDPHHLPGLYDITYEKKFRDKVLEFLQDGEVKLFKSATEGNILVRLTDVTCTPVQSLNRMLYSFSATAYEVNDFTLDNCIAYGLHVVGDWAEDFYTKETKLGQISTELTLIKDKNGNLEGQDITKMIYQKYDSARKNIAGHSRSLMNYYDIKITFEDKPLKIIPKGGSSDGSDFVLGNKMNFKGQEINVYAPNRIYEVDGDISCGMQENLTILGDAENQVSKINVTVDFLYDVIDRPYVGKRIKEQRTIRGLGQLFQNCHPEENLFMDIYLKYYLDTDNIFNKLLAFTSVEIEAIPGAVFSIKDKVDDKNFNNKETHVIGATGHLFLMDVENIEGLVYNGIQDPATGEIIKQNTDIIINYYCLIQKGTYKTNNEVSKDE